ncbi:MAG: serine/threonine protein kinase [Deltaproteobacteria bacterium]|nr:serine/threonine protein kinase [Deltaproteobacteria bacterium]
MNPSPTSPPQPRLADGTPARLGRYRIVRPISSGGMARVYEGRRESIAGVSTRVAIKVILPDFAGEARFRDLFINEARIGSLLNHQNLVQIQDFDLDDGVYFLVMEYVEGVTLRRCISLSRRNGQHIGRHIVAELGRQVAEGLHHAHTARNEAGNMLGLVHRDIKPSNLMLNPQGAVKVLDFGISKALLTQESRGAVRGTWGYMAPEQALCLDVGPQADVFGLAVVLFEMLTLEPLFPEKDESIIRALLEQDEAARRAARIMGQAGPLGNVLIRALQRDPAARYATAEDMARALAGIVGDPVLSREGLVAFQQQMVALDRQADGAEPPRRASTALVAPAALGPTGLGVGHPGALPDGPGLPVSVGSGMGADLQLGHRPDSLLRSSGPAQPRWGPLIAGLFTLTALAVIGFTGWRLLERPRVVAPSPAAVAPAAPKPAPAPKPSPSTAALATPVEEPAPADPAPKTPRDRPPDAPRPEPAAPRPAPAPAPAPAGVGEVATGSGLLTISSIPKARVTVDGRFIRDSPLYNFQVEAGAHVVVLDSEDGRRKSFKVEVAPNATARRTWSFDEDRFIE